MVTLYFLVVFNCSINCGVEQLGPFDKITCEDTRTKYVTLKDKFPSGKYIQAECVRAG